MTTHVNEEVITVVAGEALTNAEHKYKAVAIAGTITPTVGLALGLLVTSVQSGGHASVVHKGVTKAWAAAAVASGGTVLTITTSGYVASATSGQYTIGRALEPASSGDLFRVSVDFTNLGYKVA